MRKLVALFCVFNADKLLPHSIASVVNFVDEVRVYDGRFDVFIDPCGKNHDVSCDGTKAVAESFGATYATTPPMPESQKRSLILNGLKSDEVGLVIDDDELFYGDPRVLRDFVDTLDTNSSQVGWVNILFLRHSVIPLARLFMGGATWKCGAFYEVSNDQGVAINMVRLRLSDYPGCHILPKSAMLVELWNYRELERIKAQEDYDALIAKSLWKV